MSLFEKVVSLRLDQFREVAEAGAGGSHEAYTKTFTRLVNGWRQRMAPGLAVRVQRVAAADPAYRLSTCRCTFSGAEEWPGEAFEPCGCGVASEEGFYRRERRLRASLLVDRLAA